MGPRPVAGQPRDAERRDLEALRTAIRAGLDSGPYIPADQVFAELRARYAAKA
jgi:antitoxin ParD1/3/4